MTDNRTSKIISGELERPGDPEFMSSLARGLAVMRCVADSSRPVTIADVSRRLGLSRAAVRRCLYTLSMLGYVGQDDRGYAVRRKALGLGHPFLSLNTLAARAQPLLDTLRDRLGESCSLGVMEDDGLYYVARAEMPRVMAIGLRVGSRLPLYPTSMGRILLAGCEPPEREAYFSRIEPLALTSNTVTDPRRLLEIIRDVATQGFAIVDQELEIGLRSAAVPVTEKGRVVAALNVGTSVSRVSLEEFRERIIPSLLEAAEKLSI